MDRESLVRIKITCLNGTILKHFHMKQIVQLCEIIVFRHTSTLLSFILSVFLYKNIKR